MTSAKNPAMDPGAQGEIAYPITEMGSPPPGLCLVRSATSEGSMAQLVAIECSFGKGFSGIQVIGYTGTIINNGKERARMALESCGVEIPPTRILLSFSPGDLEINGNQFDLAMTVGIWGLLNKKHCTIVLDDWVFAAEIGLDGRLRPVVGIVGIAVAAMAQGLAGVVISADNAPEVRALEAASELQSSSFHYRPFENLQDVIHWIRTGRYPELRAFEVTTIENSEIRTVENFDDMLLSEHLKLAAEVSAVGLHNIYMRGVPGSGKSMFARRLISIWPNLEAKDHLSALLIHSANPEKMNSGILSGIPPFRSPHHFASMAAVLGAGQKPGEVALASGGILFLDEFPEFRRDVVEALREPLETKEVQVSRARTKQTWEARMILVAAANNCPCGWRSSKYRQCDCPSSKVLAYQSRVSGAILDRIDIHVNMPEPNHALTNVFTELNGQPRGQTKAMRDRVQRGRAFSRHRNLAWGIEYNRDIPTKDLSEVLGIAAPALTAFFATIIKMPISTRSATRLLRVARTIADLRESSHVNDDDLMQAWSWHAHKAAIERGDTF
jgi:magnesium chelatase family protein